MTLLSFLFASMVPIQVAPGGSINGSGVLVNPSLVLTAAHVIHMPVVGVRCGVVDIPATMVAANEAVDLALLELAQPCPLPVSPIARINPHAGAYARAEGCPSGRCGWIIKGSVVGYDVLDGPTKIPRTMLISDTPIWFGSSGGPLFDERGRVVGIASQMFQLPSPDDTIFRLFAAFVPAETIYKFYKAAIE